MRASPCIVVVVVVGIGCGGGGLDPEDLFTAVEDSFCDRYVRCGVVASHADCVALFEGSFATAALELRAGIDNGTIRYDGDAAQDCVDAFARASCDETTAEVRVEPAACREAIRGTVPDGGGCAISAQCESGRCDTPACPDACCAGSCLATIVEAAIGQPCNSQLDNCAAGAFCNASQTCEALHAANQPCTADDNCDYGLHCTDAGTCVDAPNEGDACPDGSCADIGNGCDNASATCVALGGAGASCGPSGNGVGCQALYICDQATSTCSARPAVGQPCTFACAPGAYCDLATQVCAADKADGQPCDSSGECISGHCDDATMTCGQEAPCL